MQTLTTGTPWKKILAFMLPVFAGLLLQQLYNIVDTIIVGNFAGEAALASVGACGVLTLAFLALANGFSAGAGNIDRVKLGVKHTVIMSEIISIILIIIVYVFAQPIVGLFGLGAGAAVYCVAHTRCIALCLIPFASYFPLLGVFQGANDALYATLVAASALAMRVASTYLLKEVPQIGYHMVWWNTAFGWGLGFFITWFHYVRGKWKRKIK